jgi:hypothetical protein
MYIQDKTRAYTMMPISIMTRISRKKKHCIPRITLPTLLLLLTATSNTNEASAFRLLLPSVGRSQRPVPHTTSPTTELHLFAFVDEVVTAYKYGLEYHTLPTEAATAAVLASFGDCLAQARDILDPEKPQHQEYSLSRTRNFFIKGVGSGVIWSTYYRQTDVLCTDWATDILAQATTADPSFNMVEGSFGFATVKTVVAVILEDVIACPIVYSLWDIPVPALLSGSPIRTIPNQVKSKIVDLIIENAKVWSVVNIVIYNIPVQYRLLVMSIANVFWQTIVSTITSRDVVEENIPGDDLNEAEPILENVAAEERTIVRQE